MQNLIPFQHFTSPITLKGDIQRLGADLRLKFEISDPLGALGRFTRFSQTGSQIPREDGLWNETCFEMFLRPQGGKAYYEFNFSLKPAWNEYVFQDYRKPQPPTPSDEFRLRQMQWDGRILQIDLYSLKPISQFEASLTAVLKETKGDKHYLALAHKGRKADFHLPESFILKR